MTLREQLAALYDTARSLTLIRIADTGHAIAAWAETRDIDEDHIDFLKANQ